MTDDPDDDQLRAFAEVGRDLLSFEGDGRRRPPLRVPEGLKKGAEHRPDHGG
jgi:hypothetical protein